MVDHRRRSPIGRTAATVAALIAATGNFFQLLFRQLALVFTGVTHRIFACIFLCFFVSGRSTWRPLKLLQAPRMPNAIRFHAQSISSRTRTIQLQRTSALERS